VSNYGTTDGTNSNYGLQIGVARAPTTQRLTQVYPEIAHVMEGILHKHCCWDFPSPSFIIMSCIIATTSGKGG